MADAVRKKMNRMTDLWILLACFALLTTSCNKAQENGQNDSGNGRGPDSSQQVKDATGDLAGRLGVPSGEIELVKESSVTWRNGSMGCPKEGMMYTQALVEGALIVLRVDGKNFQYHSGKGRPPFLCENPEKPAAKAKSSLE
jgi:hypothetical protein